MQGVKIEVTYTMYIKLATPSVGKEVGKCYQNPDIGRVSLKVSVLGLLGGSVG